MNCPKCGSAAGWNGPRLGRRVIGVARQADWWPIEEDCLNYECNTCGYVRKEPTLDAKPRAVEVRIPKPSLKAAFSEGRFLGLHGLWDWFVGDR